MIFFSPSLLFQWHRNHKLTSSLWGQVLSRENSCKNKINLTILPKISLDFRWDNLGCSWFHKDELRKWPYNNVYTLFLLFKTLYIAYRVLITYYYVVFLLLGAVQDFSINWIITQKLTLFGLESMSTVLNNKARLYIYNLTSLSMEINMPNANYSTSPSSLGSVFNSTDATIIILWWLIWWQSENSPSKRK